MPALVVALRRLRHSPVFTIFSIVTLALGIGVTTAVYSGIRVMFGRSEGMTDTDRAVFVTRFSASTGRDYPLGLSWADYRDLAERQRSFSSIAATSWFSSAIAGRDTSQLGIVQVVTGSYFNVLGVRPALGRPIQPGDDRPDAPLVAVLSDAIWRGQFDANPAIVGTTVRLANQTVEVIGVAPNGFRGPQGRAGFLRLLAWVPLATASRLDLSLTLRSDRKGGSLSVLGRLKPEATVEGAGVEIATIGAQLDESAPLPPPSSAANAPPARVLRAWKATSVDTILNSADLGEAMRLLLALPTLVLLVACTNLANLVLSRGVSRRHEFAVRAALGASRARLIREELIETTAIAVAGGALGMAVTTGLLNTALVVLREPLSTLAPEVLLDWRFDPSVLAAVAIAVIVTLVIAGLVPALQLTRPNPGRTLAADSGGALPRWRGRSNLIALQVGVSVGLFLITLISVRFIMSPPASEVPRTANLTGLAIASVPFERQQYPDARARPAIDAVVAELGRSREIEVAAAATELPVSIPGLRGASSNRWVLQPGQPCPEGDLRAEPPSADKIGATSAFYGAIGIQLLSGRLPDDRDVAGAEPVVVLNESLAKTVFGQSNATGRTVSLCADKRYSLRPGIETATVVGIVADGERDRRGRANPVVFAPIAQYFEGAVVFIARGRSGDGRATVSLLTSTIRRVDPDIAILTAGRADAMARGPMVFLGFVASVAGGLATLALVLAMAGLYGVLSHVVEKRRREMGVRVALGASHGRIVKLVLKDGLRPVAEGTFIGLGAALVIRQVLQLSFTAPLSSIDVATFLLAAVPLVAAGIIAAYVPARRAANVEPNRALKDL
jgi:putative ABC transport system permease protein